MVQINGQAVAAHGRPLLDYLSEHGYDPKRIAVERNEEIVPKGAYATTILSDGDVVEIVNFVGGG